MTALKRIAGYLVLSTVIPLALLLTLEGLVSLGMLAQRVATVRPPVRPPLTVPDTLLGWSAQPNVALPNAYGPGLSLTHDASGMRIPSAAARTLAAGERRLVCTGGVLVYGAGVADSQTICAYLERELPGVHALSMAQPGFGIDQAFLSYRRDGGRYDHRLLMLGVTRGDFDRMAKGFDRGYAKPVLALESGRLVAEGVPLADGSGSNRWDEVASAISDSRLAQAIERRTGWLGARRRRQAERSWSVAQSLLRELAGDTRARGTRVVLVYLPTLGDLRAGVGDDWRAALDSSSRQAGLPLVDLTAEMRAVPADTADWFFITPNARTQRGLTGHYSAAGNRWVAARVAERLRAMPDAAPALGVAR